MPASNSTNGILPNELYEHILSYCTRIDLFALTLADRRISCIANPLLYRDISRLHSLSKTIQLFSSLLFYDHTAALVRKLRVDFVWFSASLSHPLSKRDVYLCVKKIGARKTFLLRDVLNTHFTLLKSVLQKTNTLEQLELIFEHTESSDETFGRLVTGASFHLRSLTTSFQLGPALRNFLEDQRSLQDLNLSNHVPYPTSFLQNLDTLGSKSISHITMIGWSTKTPMEVVFFLAERGTVKSICIDLTAMLYHGIIYSKNYYFSLGIASEGIERARIKFGDLFHYGESVGFKYLNALTDSLPSLRYCNLILSKVTTDALVVFLLLAPTYTLLEHLVITGYYSDITDWKSHLPPLVEDCFGRWENLRLLEIAVEYNGSIWHNCFKRVVRWSVLS